MIRGSTGFLWLGLGLFCVACQGTPSADGEKELPVAVSPGPLDRSAQEPQEQKAGDQSKTPVAKPMLPAGHLSDEEPLVGGCREACDNPKQAFRNFLLVALQPESPPGLPAISRFFDYAALVDNQHELGDRWAQLWLDHKPEQRLKEVSTWVDAYSKRIGVVSSQVALEVALSEETRFSRVSSILVEFEIVLPPLSGGTTESVWKLTFGKRGLEWLVRGIEDGYNGKEGFPNDG